ncbi:ER membrane protein complex subunit 8/9 homolog [Cryptotermes secundus]|uniref:ER membrane protein complex subunit 8/9 homolog n=1 Tax=Cryptotermes secundus TaxID=105785 RepID=UPI000CD7CF1D|nr:ER membrane protein complex subunit 8/9 homolog [Cryptotermes secundus]
MADVKFSVRAYSKMVLHAAKYPHCAINGVLLAEEQKSKDDKKGRCLFVCDAVPLFHLCLHVTPMAEIALTQIDHMASTSGLVLAGYYLANENMKDLSYEKCGQRIADKIAENFSSACLVVIDNRRLTLSMENMALCVSQFVDGKWKSKEKSSVSLESNSKSVAAALLQRRVHEQLIDFDNHLDDLSQDWRNLNLNQEVEEEVGTVG